MPEIRQQKLFYPAVNISESIKLTGRLFLLKTHTLSDTESLLSV